MGTTTQKLQKVLTSKNAIKAAIKNKTGVDPGDKMSTYVTEINNLEVKTPASFKIFGGTVQGTYISLPENLEVYVTSKPANDQSTRFLNDEQISYMNLKNYMQDVIPTNLSNMFDYSYINEFEFGDIDLSQVVDCSGMFVNSQLEKVTFPNNFAFGKSTTSLNNGGLHEMFYSTYLSTVDLQNENFNTDACRMFCGCDLTDVTIKNVNFSMKSDQKLNDRTYDHREMFNGNTKLKNIVMDNVCFSNAALDSFFKQCTTLTTVDLSTCDLRWSDLSNMFHSCTKLTSVTILDDISTFSDVTDMFKNITTTGKFYYDPYYVTDEDVTNTAIYKILPSKWTMVPIEYTISAYKSLSISIPSDVIITQYVENVDVDYRLITDGNVGKRQITDRALSGTATSASFGKNTTGKDRTVTVSYTMHGLTATVNVTQKYVKPTITVDGNWQMSTSSKVTGEYKYECYGGGEEEHDSVHYLYVTIPPGINVIKFDCYTDAEGADYLYVSETSYTMEDVVYMSGVDYSETYECDLKELIGEDWDRTEPVSFDIRYEKDVSVAEGTDTVYVGLTFVS